MTDWSHIVNEHGPVVWKTVRRLVDSEADAADCFQRTFVSALELSRTEVVRNWHGLLKRLATARALECLRQRQRLAHRFSQGPVELAVDGKAVRPVAAAEASALAEQLRVALADLEDRQAEAFCLACLEGFSYQEVAEQLAVTVNHVGVLLNRAKAKLRERLRTFGPAVRAATDEREVRS